MGKVETYDEAFEAEIRSILDEHFADRRELFWWWFGEGRAFTCRRCEEEFRPPDDVTGNDEILCGRCGRRR